MVPDPLHPAVVHLPLALAVLVPLFALLGLLAIRTRFLPVRAWGAIGRFRWQGERSLYQWLRGIAQHVIFEAASAERRRSKRTERDGPGHTHCRR